MSIRPTLALCIPAYNAEQYLPTLLDSARQQTQPFDEIWVYDDASSDRTALIAEQAGARVVRGTSNRGCSYGKNQLAAQSSCDWVHFHDADDALLPEFVARSRIWMEQPNPPDVVLFGSEFRDFDTNGLLVKTVYDDAALRENALRYTVSAMITSICGLYRRAPFLKAGGYDLDPLVLYNEDSAMHCQLARAGLRFAADPAITIIGYRHSRSMSQSNQTKCFQSQYHVMKKAAATKDPSLNPALARRLWEIASASASWGDWQNVQAAVALAETLDGRHAPYPRWWMRLLCRLAPVPALRLREALIHRFKPGLRDRGTRYG